ncbi:TetR/AcrR family transcriptional regulator [Sulfitobacter sp. G21635-S1]|uniref:TetR/AcrR family transcriptional regulator n=1 Tax=Sulfitobacter sp. G21635-S1 TaxID=3014043 RepID=UPI0022AFA9D2|nr:TetR/AcrR family transcriptional regulator [Sulfitobacter sp. G21635-S1]MCZ4256346.1 TetR/AcrR family transcriptional regulator [Sulfitobacter sp. G21635-S1]
MKQPVQKRTLETRARLVAAAKGLVAAQGYAALRVEDVVAKAGVAKGTFFAHFPDKDALMDLLIGAEIDRHLDAIADLPAPRDVDEFVTVLMPLLRFMTCERYVFDVILRHSGAALAEEIGPIATTFVRQAEVVAAWLDQGPFRRDVSPDLLAEGVQAFATQAMALHFCALHNAVPLDQRLRPYLSAWLQPGI